MLLPHLAGIAAFVSTALGQVDFDTPPTCHKVQIIAACGTFQTRYGTIDTLVESMTGSIQGSSSVALEYPANTSPYQDSVQAGVTNMTRYIEYFVDGCPNTQLLLVGYSQGAHVSLTTLCGWQEGRWQFYQTDPLPSKYSDRIIGVVAYGDPTHNYPSPYDQGTSTHDGLYPRQPGECDAYTSKIRSWCNHGDEFCDDCPPPANARSSNPRGCDNNVHHDYPNTDNTFARQFAVSRVAADATTRTSMPTRTPASVTGAQSSTTSTSTTTIVVTSTRLRSSSSSSSSAESSTTSGRVADTTAAGASATATGSGAGRLAPPGFLAPFKILGLQR